MKITMEFEINNDEEMARLVVLLQAMRCMLIRFVCLPESELIPCVVLQAHGGDNATGASPEPW